MKKSLFALLISSIFILNGCDDQQLTQKLSEAEKKIAQLENDYKQAQELLSAKLESQQKIPALNVEIVELFNKSEVIKHPKTDKIKDDQVDETENYQIDETEYTLFVSTAKTGIEWLDKLLLKELSLTLERLSENKNLETEEQIRDFLNEKYQKDHIELKAEPIYRGFEWMLSTHYMGQRKNIATFIQSRYQYTGGAHGDYGTRYLNIDANKQAIIQLDDLIPKENQAALKDILWQDYRNKQQGDETTSSIEKAVELELKETFFIPSNFYFTLRGIQFVYPLYELGSFADGEIELSADYALVKELINPDYLPR